jgi:hypothetical protein
MSRETIVILLGLGKSDKRPPLITPEQPERLLANGGFAREMDHVPVVKLFDLLSSATWLITERALHRIAGETGLA